RYLSGYSLWRANLIGATIGFFTPLCCCTAIPTALTLWRGGSRAGPACAFLIATPWFNWYGLVALWIFLGWQVAFAVASSAILIAFLTGMLIDLVTAKTLPSSPRQEALNKTISATDPPSLGQSASTCCVADTPCGGDENKENGFFDFSRPRDKFKIAWRNTWMLGRELLPWIFVGILLGATVKIWLPKTWLTHLGSQGFKAPLLALVIASVLYTDSLGSLPMVKALLGKGLGAGNAMILLVAGVGTSLATLGPINREMGRRVAFIYVSSILLLAFAFGLFWNALLAPPQ
ncbi:permease, partial [Acidiphilium sp.]|uniref:permease n=1 Tax=Acidiphilium sp. TaxID=527 RepID=UPI00258E741F